MLCYILVIALFFPSFAHAAGNETNKHTICNDTKVIEAAGEFFKCNSVTIDNALTFDNKTSSCNNNITLAKTLSNYVEIANETCFNGTVTKERKGLDYLELLKFSLKYNRLAEFLKNGGVDCIKAIKERLSSCVKMHFGGNPPTESQNYSSLWKKTKLSIKNTPCLQASKIKGCTVRAMEKQGRSICMYGNNVMYVSSLFDFMLERCDALDNRTSTKKQRPHRPTPEELLSKDVRTTNILMGVILSLGLLSVVYVLIRDCRAGTGRWKIFNEQFQMRTRNRSLVDECGDN